MKFETFEKMYNLVKNHHKMVEDLYTSLKIDLQESPLNDTVFLLFKTVIIETYGKTGMDWVAWFMYEKEGYENPEEMKAWDKDGNEICRNLLELWQMLEQDCLKS